MKRAIRITAFASSLLASACNSSGSLAPIGSQTSSARVLPEKGGKKEIVPPATSSEFLGCPYPGSGGAPFQNNVSNAQSDPNSAAYIKAMDDSTSSGYQNMPEYFTLSDSEQFGGKINTTSQQELINNANKHTPLVPATSTSEHTVITPVPWGPNFAVEPPNSTDQHSMVLNTSSCHYYEGIETVYYSSGPSLTFYANQLVDLTKAYAQPPEGNISTTSGIPMGLLAVRPEEFAAGVIPHTLGWNAIAHTLSQTACVYPAASHNNDCTDALPYIGPNGDLPAPYGSHAVLKTVPSCSGNDSAAETVITALKTYGAYIYDTGDGNELLSTSDAQGDPTAWNSDDVACLDQIVPDDFVIIPPPPPPGPPR